MNIIIIITQDSVYVTAITSQTQWRQTLCKVALRPSLLTLTVSPPVQSMLPLPTLVSRDTTKQQQLHTEETPATLQNVTSKALLKQTHTKRNATVRRTSVVQCLQQVLQWRRTFLQPKIRYCCCFCWYWQWRPFLQQYGVRCRKNNARSLAGVSVSWSLQCFDIDGLVTGRTDIRPVKIPMPLFSKGSLNCTEPANLVQLENGC